jgi:putative transposase
MTPYPQEEWMKQIARNATLEGWGFLANCQYLLHDRDGKFCPAFDRIIELGNVQPIQLPARSPNLNSHCERLIGSLRRDCLDFLIPMNESHLREILREYKTHYNQGRPHSSLGPGLPESRLGFPLPLGKQRHQVPVGRRVSAKPILCGLHHEYRLEKIAA